MESVDGAPAPPKDFDSYARPAIAVDPVVLEVSDGALKVAVGRRDVAPHEGTWALPGVFVQVGETLDDAVRRGVAQKCKVAHLTYVEQLFTWDMAGRDPRGWVVAVAYFAVVPSGTLQAAALHDPNVLIGDVNAKWDGDHGDRAFVCADGERIPLAFDHEQILGAALARLRGRVRYTPLAFEFLPSAFTLRQLQTVYEAILGSPLNKDSFRRHVVSTMGFVEPTGELEQGVAHRPAELYRQAVHRSTD